MEQQLDYTNMCRRVLRLRILLEVWSAGVRLPECSQVLLLYEYKASQQPVESVDAQDKVLWCDMSTVFSQVLQPI